MITGGRSESLKAGQFVGPIEVPGNVHMPSDIPLYVGKAVRRPATVGG